MANIPVEILFYVCGCGCKVPPEKIFKYKKTSGGESVHHHRCPDHKSTEISRVVDLVMKCETCGEFFGGARALYCHECRKERKKENVRRYTKIYYQKHPERHVSFKGDMYVDGKKPEMDCLFFGNTCGKVCVWPEFKCDNRRALHKIENKDAA